MHAQVYIMCVSSNLCILLPQLIAETVTSLYLWLYCSVDCTGSVNTRNVCIQLLKLIILPQLIATLNNCTYTCSLPPLAMSTGLVFTVLLMTI